MNGGVAFYISGHGFGHASRQVEIINAFGAREPGTPILVRTTAARWLLERTIRVPFELDDRPVDTGLVQIDSLHLDAAESMVRAREFYATFEARASDEARQLRDRGVRLVISDAPPLACEAAAAAGIPSFVVSNFTWDWIYAEYREHLHLAPGLVPMLQRAYRKADGAWRLPMHGGFETFTRIVDVPFVARHANPALSRQEILGGLRLPMDRPIALASFGGHGAATLALDRLDCLDAWTVVVTGRPRDECDDGGRLRIVSDREIHDTGIGYVNLVNAVDAVVTKPGYGIISECVAQQVPMVYTPRGRFAEYDVLVREMPRYLRCAFLDSDSLMAGRWRAALEAAVDAPEPPEHPPTNGADVVADMMAACLRDASSSRVPRSS